MPADANALSPLPSSDLGAQFIDDACHFVPRHPRILNSRPEAFFHEYVTVANTTGLHSNAHLSPTRFGNLAFNYFETCSRLRNLCHLHRSYCDCCCHEPSFEVPAIVGKAFTTTVEAAEPCSPNNARRALAKPPQKCFPARLGRRRATQYSRRPLSFLLRAGIRYPRSGPAANQT